MSAILRRSAGEWHAIGAATLESRLSRSTSVFARGELEYSENDRLAAQAILGLRMRW